MTSLDAEHDRLTRLYRSDNLRPVGDRLDGVEQAIRTLCRIKGIEPDIKSFGKWPGGTGETPDFGEQG